MPVATELNDSYLSSNLVNQKYQPLLKPTPTRDQRDEITAIANDRITAFNTLNIALNKILFIGDKITTVAATEGAAGMLPPLAIISSNRSKWIKTAYTAGYKLLGGRTNFDDVNDKSVLRYAGPVPIYCPYRLSAAEMPLRNVYIFVHANEFVQYSQELYGTGINVIGWRIGNLGNEAVGFGASRYAAVEFFKYIYRQNNPETGGPKNTKLWLIDDNAVYINNFPGFAAVETKMGTTYTGLGFKAGSGGESASFFSGELQGYRYTAATVLEGSAILQQAALWNIARINAANTNFSPYFCTSAEDSSFTKILGTAACQWYSQAKVLKAELTSGDHDNDRFSNGVKRMKDSLADFLYLNATPLKVDNRGRGGKVADLGALLDLRIEKVRNEERLPVTYSKAIEQTLTEAIVGGITLPAAMFSFTKPMSITLKNAVVKPNK